MILTGLMLFGVLLAFGWILWRTGLWLVWDERAFIIRDSSPWRVVPIE
jgi:hypothetical protein